MSFQRKQTTMIRGGGTAAVTRSGQPARSQTPLPTLYEDIEPTYQVGLGLEAENTIRRDICWSTRHLGDRETGGWLFVAEGRPNYILKATVPGSDAEVSRSSI